MQEGDISLVGKFFRNKWVILTLFINVVIIIFIIIIIINKATQTAVLNFTITPVDATITVNGSGGYENTGQALENDQNSGRFYSFTPGTYEIQISHPDLDTKIITVDLKPNSNTTVTTFLSKDNDLYFYTLKDNSGSFYRLVSIASASNNQTTDHDTSAESFISQQERQDSINKITPIRFSICEEPATRVNCNAVEVTYDYSKKCDNQKCLIIKGRKEELTSDVTKELSSRLISNGYNINNYRYIYEQDTKI